MITSERFSKEYLEHKVFGQLTEYIDFYDNLSFSIMSWISQGTKASINLDTYVYSSIKGTLDSIKDIQHFSYIFYLNGHYMMSSDYKDSLEVGLTPEEGSQYFVAPFIQNIFDKVIKSKKPDLANEIKNKTTMKLE